MRTKERKRKGVPNHPHESKAGRQPTFSSASARPPPPLQSSPTNSQCVCLLFFNSLLKHCLMGSGRDDERSSQGYVRFSHFHCLRVLFACDRCSASAVEQKRDAAALLIVSCCSRESKEGGNGGWWQKEREKLCVCVCVSSSFDFSVRNTRGGRLQDTGREASGKEVQREKQRGSAKIRFPCLVVLLFFSLACLSSSPA